MLRRMFMSALAVAAFQLASPAYSRDSTTTIHFAHHATEATLSGSLKGYDSANFLVGVKAGQAMKVSFTPNNASCYFNVWPPGQRPGGSGSAIFIGSSEGNEFAGTLSEDGSYMIQAGSFQNASDADNMKAKLALIGLMANVEPTAIPDKGTWYRVRLGPYASLGEINHIRSQLASNGVDATLIKLKD